MGLFRSFEKELAYTLQNKQKQQRTKALEILDGTLANCSTSAEFSYICGVTDLALELELITINERNHYRKESFKKMDDKRIEDARQRTAERERLKAERIQKAKEAREKK